MPASSTPVECIFQLLVSQVVGKETDWRTNIWSGSYYFVKIETILDFKVCHVLLAYLTLNMYLGVSQLNWLFCILLCELVLLYFRLYIL